MLLKSNFEFTASNPKSELHNKIDETTKDTVIKYLYVWENRSVNLKQKWKKVRFE